MAGFALSPGPRTASDARPRGHWPRAARLSWSTDVTSPALARWPGTSAVTPVTPRYASCRRISRTSRRWAARRLAGTGVAGIALHPGLVRSHLFQDGPPRLRVLLSSVGGLFMLSPRQGARGSVYLATASEVGGESGGYYRGCRRAAPSLAAQSEACAARLWQESARLTGLAA